MPARPETATNALLRRAIVGLAFITLLAGVWGFRIPSALAQARPPEELKAAFVYNFTRFVEWPAKAFDSGTSPFVIGIAGDEDVAREVQTIVKGEKVGNRPFQIRSCRRPRDGEGCHLLYIGSGGRIRADEFLDIVKGTAVLTVGETTDFLRQGGVIQFVTERTIRLRIDLRNARRANLTISSQLLRLAEIEKQ